MAAWRQIAVRTALRSVALLLVQATAGEAAGGRGEAQATSSASIEIRLSVAAQYRLKPAAGIGKGAVRQAGGHGRYCIATNAVATTLPVLLVAPDGTEAGDATRRTRAPRPLTVEIPPCDATEGSAPSRPASPEIASAAAMLLVRPE